MKTAFHGPEDIGEGSVAVVGNTFQATVYGSTGHGKTVEKAVKSAILELRTRKHSYGHFPVYLIERSDGVKFVVTVEG